MIPMSRELRLLAYLVGALVVARVLVLTVDALAVGLQRRSLYSD
jgi:hypothetical protein